MEMRFTLLTIPSRGTVSVENYWFCEVIIKGEGIINYQFVRIQIKYRAIRIIFGPTRKYFALAQKSVLKF